MMQYFVLDRRDSEAEKEFVKKRKGRMIFDGVKSFKDYNSALEYANSNLPSILAKRTPLTEDEKARIRDESKPYVIAGHFPDKYRHHSYDGSSDSIPTNEAVRCSESDLERTVEKFSSEGAERILVGVELKVLGGTLK